MSADTSAVIAALCAWHERHEPAAEALEGVAQLPAHVLLEAYSVLTRLPGGLAVGAEEAARVLAERFAGAPLCLDEADRAALPGTLAQSGVVGGAAFDGLVGLEAAAHSQTLLTLDERARGTYRRLGVPIESIPAAGS